jgi:hypothetical protein
MNPLRLKQEIIDFCIQNQNDANIIKYSRYFKGGFIGYGTDSGLIEKKSK